MKRLLLIIGIVFMCVKGSAQGYPNTDSLRTYNIKYITNNAATAFTNLRLHTLLRGIIDWIDTARAGTGGGGALGIDTLYALNDSTIRYWRNGAYRNTILRGVYDTRRKVDTAYALNDTTIQIKINGTNRNIVLPGRSARFALEDNSASANRSFNFNGYNFAADSFANFSLFSKVRPTGVDRGVYSNFEINNSSIYLWGYHSNGVSPRSYGFTTTGSLTQMFATGHVSGNSGFVQTDTMQVILESGANWLHLYHDSTVLHNILGNTLDFRLRNIPSTNDTSYKALVSGPNGQVFLRPGDAGSGGATGSAGGDLTGTYPNPTIATNAVTNAKAAQMAAHTFKGNNTGSTANASDLTATQLTAELNTFGASLKGLVPAAAASPSSSKYLSEDGTFTIPPSGSGTVTQVNTGYGLTGGPITTTGTAAIDTTTLKTVYLPLNLNSAKTIRQYTNNIYFTGGGEVKSDSFRITRTTSFGSPTGLLGVGDSYMQGYRPCAPDTIFFDRLSAIYGLTGTNRGVSSTGIWRADSVHNYRVNIGHSLLSYIWAGFNDIRRGGITNDTTYRKVITGLKSIIANQFLKSWVAGGSSGSGVTRYGSWTTTYTCAAVGGKSPNNGGYTNTNNDSIVYVFPAADTTVIIATINGDNHAAGYNMGSFDIYIDGTLWGSFNGLNADGITDGFYDNARTPNAFIITGLTNAVHRIKLVNTSSNYLVVDYFGHLKDKTTSVPLLIAHAPYNNITGFAVSPNKGSVAAMLKLNNQIDSMVAVTAVGWPVYVVHTNNYLDTLTGICTDNIHPNNTGDIQIKNATLAALSVANSNVSDGTIAFTGTYFKGAANGTTHLIPWLDETLQQADTSLFIRNQTSFDQNGAFRISGASLLKNKLTVGSASLSDGSDQLDILTTAGHMRVLGFSSQNYWQSIDNTNTTGVPFNFGAGTINFGAISGGSTTNYATFNNAASNKFTVTGNALINSTVRAGSSLAATDAPITIGTIASLPYISLYRSAATTDQKIWDKIVANDSTYMFRTVNDAFLTPDTIYYVTRSGIRPNRFIMPKATLNVGYLNMQGNGLGAYFNRIIGANKDSVVLRSTTATRQMLVIDTANGRFERMNIPSTAAITSINSMTGPAVTITGGTGITASSASNDVTIAVDINNSALPHTVDKQFVDANNSGTGETDLYTKSVAGNTLNSNGQSLSFEVAGVFNDATATANLQLYFAGTAFGGTGAMTLTGTGAWRAQGSIVRVSSSVYRANVTFFADNTSQKIFSSMSNVTSVDFTTSNTFKITGTAGGGGGGSNDITAQMWIIRYDP